MQKLLKKLKNKRGFSLVECVVAMGVLSVMTLMVTMMLAGAVRMKAQNHERETEIGDQIHALANDDDSLTKEDFNGEIAFYQGGSKIDAIGNGTGGEGIEAKRVYDDDATIQIGALDYDFDEYQAKVEELEFEAIGSEKAQKVYGGADITGSGITITEGKTLNGGFYDVQWQVKYSLNSVKENETIKIALPDGALFDTYPAGSTNQNVIAISDRLVRIYSGGSNTVNVTIKFSIPTSKYYGSLGEYLEKGNGSSVNLQRQSNGLLK